MKSVRKWLLAGIAAAIWAAMLSGCGPAEQRETEIIETQTEAQQEEEAEAGYETWLQRYTVRSVSITLTNRKEAVLFQQEFDGGFLTFINRRIAVEIPSGYEDETEFVNDGRYDVYGSTLFTVTEDGRRNMIRRYRPLPTPENTEQLERYFSEIRPRAFRMRTD